MQLEGILLARMHCSAAGYPALTAHPPTHHYRNPCRRRHAPQMRQVAVELKRCCQGLAAVLRDNAPVGPSVAQLERLEAAFWELQQEVGEAAVASAAAHSASTAAAAEAAVEQLIATERQDAGGDAAEAAAMNGFSEQAAETAAAAGAATGDGAQEAEDSLALHLSLSMLFTCCTRVRSAGCLLPPASAGVPKCLHIVLAAADPAWDLLHSPCPTPPTPPHSTPPHHTTPHHTPNTSSALQHAGAQHVSAAAAAGG